MAFSEGLDALIADYLSYCEKIRKAYEFDAIPRSAYAETGYCLYPPTSLSTGDLKKWLRKPIFP